jgi:hypothetical protein
VPMQPGMKRAGWLFLALVVACTTRNPAYREGEVIPGRDAEEPGLPADAAPALPPDAAAPAPDAAALPPDLAVVPPDLAVVSPDLAMDVAPREDLPADLAPALNPDLPPSAPDSGPPQGLTGFYYKDETLTTLAFERIDPVIDFSWGNETPDPTIPLTYSIRWTGRIRTLYAETYTFSIHSSDGCRLWIDGLQVMNNWKNQAPTEIAATPIALTSGWHSIRLEYLHDNGWSAVRIYWASPTQKKGFPAAQYLLPN